ncbi:protein LURP-one-related 15 [Eucalyptus grandis]|nr:protein LURP-one-related 15 [Eucalyptus grandis]
MQLAPPPVVGPQNCCTYATDVAILRKAMTLSSGNFVVTNSSGDLIFKVKGALLTLHDRRVLIDATGQPVLTLRREIRADHGPWRAFKGKSSDMRDLVFTAKISSAIQLELEVFLASNRNEDVRDFNVKGFERSCVIYAGQPPCIIAQMQKETGTQTQSVPLGKDKFMVTVYPNIDRAFIVALIVIFDEIKGGDW